jgi:hypothetical protein
LSDKPAVAPATALEVVAVFFVGISFVMVEEVVNHGLIVLIHGLAPPLKFRLSTASMRRPIQAMHGTAMLFPSAL